MSETQRMQQEREIGVMFDPRADFVSLVDRGANQIPFKIVKAQEPRMKVLHSIIAKKGVEADKIRGLLDEESAKLVKFDQEADRGESTAFVQIPRDKFKADSLELVVLDKDSGIMALQGELIEKADGIVAKFLNKAPREVVALKDAELADFEVVKSQYTDEVYWEMDKANMAIAGIMGQEMGDAAQKFASVSAVLDNLKAFLSEACMVTKGQALVKREQPQEIAKSDEQEAPVPDPTEEQKPEEAPVEPTPEADTPVEDPVEQVEAPVEAPQPDMAEVVKSAVEAAVEPLRKEIDDLKQMNKDQAETIAKMQATPAGVIRTGASDHESKQKGQGSVFDGLIFRQPA